MILHENSAAKPHTPARSATARRGPHRLLGALTVVSLLIAWFAVTPELVGELVFPSPESVASAASSLGWSLLFHALVTGARVVLAVALGVPIGILAGFLISWSPSIRAAIHPLIEIVRPLPPTALIPFFIIWFGIGITGQILLTGLAVFMVLLVETLGAVGTVPLLYIRAARSLGASDLDLYASIIFPAITPTLVGSVRVAAALGFAVGIAAEFMGAQSGIGYLMMVARRTLNTDTIFLGILVIAGQSYCLDLLIRRAGASLCRWKDVSVVLLTNQVG